MDGLATPQKRPKQSVLTLATRARDVRQEPVSNPIRGK